MRYDVEGCESFILYSIFKIIAIALKCSTNIVLSKSLKWL